MIDRTNPPLMLNGNHELAQYLGMSVRWVVKMNTLGVFNSARHRVGHCIQYNRQEIDRITKVR